MTGHLHGRRLFERVDENTAPFGLENRPSGLLMIAKASRTPLELCRASSQRESDGRNLVYACQPGKNCSLCRNSCTRVFAPSYSIALRFTKSETATPVERLHYALNLPVSLVITGC
jgi:hypothetical protein